jgi:hypothetical protein
MPRNGSGTMSVVNSFSPSTQIESAKVNQNFTDIASEITGSLPRNGEAGMTGQIKIDAGTVSLPGLAWSVDLDTGWYRIGANNAGFSCGGAKVLDVSTSGLGLTGALDVSGALTLGTALAVAEGGTGSTSAADARTALGLEIGANVQAYDDDLMAIAGLAKTDGNIIVGDGSGWVAESGATARTSLGLGSIATQAANNVAITGGSIYGAVVRSTAQATTSGTSIDFTSIPAGVKRITVVLAGVSTNGTSKVIVQIGDSGGIETSSYAGAGARLRGTTNIDNFTDGFAVGNSNSASDIRTGVGTLLNISGDVWVWEYSGALENDTETCHGGGQKTVSATLDRIRLTTQGGVNTFDAGSINIFYE